MSCLPQLYSKQRAPRALLTGVTPAVLRFPDGRRTAGKLQVLSVTGGLLSLSDPLLQGSQVKLMFLTGAGSILGGAEMLSPVNGTLQPFRFTSIAADDQRRLGATIQAALPHDSTEPQWIEKLRAASGHRNTTRTWLLKLLKGAVGLVSLASAIYLLRLQVLR
jgi:hypothetical protein